MATRKVRWGILGVARINARLIPAFARTTHGELRAIASRSLDRASEAARASGIPKAYGSYQALLDDSEIDAVYIPLPNHLHFEWTHRAAQRGKHVLCEKPLATSAADAASLSLYCRTQGVQLMDGFMWPHHPRNTQIRKLLDARVLGRIERVSATLTFPLPPDPGNIRLNSTMGGGSLLDVGCYPVYGIRWAMGAEPSRVFATARYEHGVDMEVNGLLQFADGRVASFDCGFTMPQRGWMEITGSEGTIFVPHFWHPEPQASFTLHLAGRDAEVIGFAGHDQIVLMLDNFNRAVLTNVPVQPPAGEAARTLRILDALALSAKERCEVSIASGVTVERRKNERKASDSE